MGNAFYIDFEKERRYFNSTSILFFFFLFVCMFADFFEMSRPIQIIPLVSRRIRLHVGPVKKVSLISRLPLATFFSKKKKLIFVGRKCFHVVLYRNECLDISTCV